MKGLLKQVRKQNGGVAYMVCSACEHMPREHTTYTVYGESTVWAYCTVAGCTCKRVVSWPPGATLAPGH